MWQISSIHGSRGLFAEEIRPLVKFSRRPGQIGLKKLVYAHNNNKEGLVLVCFGEMADLSLWLVLGGEMTLSSC